MLSTLSGWRGLPGARGSHDPIPGAHGSFAAQVVLREGRSIAMTGAAAGVDSAAASDLLLELESACGDRLVELRVGDDTGVWSRMVEVLDFAPDVRWNRATIQFTLDLFAPDPVRYSDLLTVGPVGLPTQSGGLFLPAALPWDLGTLDMAIADVVNTGSLPVLPVVRLTGSASSMVIHGGPRTVSFGAFDGELVIDNLQRRAFLNGADVTRSLILRNWHQVPAGVTHGFFFEAVAPSPGTSMTVEYRIGEW